MFFLDNSSLRGEKMEIEKRIRMRLIIGTSFIGLVIGTVLIFLASKSIFPGSYGVIFQTIAPFGLIMTVMLWFLAALALIRGTNVL